MKLSLQENALQKLRSLVLLLALGCSLPAQPGSLPLPEAMRIALEENQNIELSQLELAIADARDNWGQAGLLPTLSTQGGYTYSVNDISQQLAVGNDSTPGPPRINTIDDAVSESWNASANLNYVLFDGLGRINNLRQLGLQKDLTETQLRFNIENTMLQLFNSYYNSARLLEQQSVDREAIELSFNRYQRAEAAFELGSGSRLEMLSALVDLRTDSVNLLNTRREYRAALRSLNVVLNFPADSVYLIDTNLRLEKELSYAELQELASSSNAAVVQAQINREITERGVAVARSDYWPELSGNLGYVYNRQENEGSFLQFSENEGWQAGISLRWTLFNGYRTATQVEVARIRLDQSEIELEQANRQLDVDLADAYDLYRNNLQIIAMEERNLAVAKLNYQRSLEAYKLGQINNSQLREAQLNYTRSKTRLKNMRYSSKLAEIDLLRIAGVLIQDQPQESE